MLRNILAAAVLALAATLITGCSGKDAATPTQVPTTAKPPAVVTMPPAVPTAPPLTGAAASNPCASGKYFDAIQQGATVGIVPPVVLKPNGSFTDLGYLLCHSSNQTVTAEELISFIAGVARGNQSKIVARGSFDTVEEFAKVSCEVLTDALRGVPSMAAKLDWIIPIPVGIPPNPVPTPNPALRTDPHCQIPGRA